MLTEAAGGDDDDDDAEDDGGNELNTSHLPPADAFDSVFRRFIASHSLEN